MSTTEASGIRALWWVGLLHAFTHVYHVALMPLYLLMQRDLGFASVGQATSLVTVLMLAYFVPSYGLGVLADRLDRRRLLGWGLALNGLGFVALALAPNYPWAVASVLLAGVGGSCYHPAATAMIARLFPASTGRALGLIGIGASLGFFCGPLFAGGRAASLEGVRGAAAWRVPVFELGLAGIVVAGLFGWLTRGERLVAAASRSSPAASGLFPTGALWWWFSGATLALSLRDFAGAGMCSLSSLFLQQAHGYGTRWAGLALSGLFLAGVVSNPLFGHLSDRGRKRWLTGLLLTAATLVAVFPHLPAGWTVPAFIAYGFFFNANFPIVEAELMQSVPDMVRGRVFGLFMTVAGFVGNLSHWAVGDAVRRLGEAAHAPAAYAPFYAVLAGLMVVALAALPCLHAIRKGQYLTDRAVDAAFAPHPTLE